jgi:hypothetical protein
MTHRNMLSNVVVIERLYEESEQPVARRTT